MNRYSDGTIYFGLVVSPTGFTSGCEPWATSHNVAIVPPLKGRRLAFNEDTVLRMFERVLIALRARLRLRVDDLHAAPAFFDFVFRLVGDFEGHQDAVTDGRYLLIPQEWASSFGEMYSAIAQRKVENLWAVPAATVIKLSDGMILQFSQGQVQFGHDPRIEPNTSLISECRKNIEMEPCTLDFVKSIAIGKSITSAGDFGTYLEVGLDQRYNLGLHEQGVHLISTESPIEEHRL
jgi:hypothetical protein